MMLGLQLFGGPDGDMLADFGHAERLEISDGEHGFEALTAYIPMTEEEAFRWYIMPGVPWAVVSSGDSIAWEGLVEDVALVDRGLEITALGNWRALSDRPYTALWSRTSTAGWRPATPDDLSAFDPSRWEMDNNNRIYIAPRKGETFPSGSTSNIGAQTYAAPHNGERNIVVCQFAWQFFAPTNWIVRLMRSQDDFSSRSVVANIAAGNGALQTGAFFGTFAGSPRLMFEFFNNTGGSVTITQDTGVNFFRATSIRLATATTNQVNTTLGTNILPGTHTVTPASMANIYVGQQLVIGGLTEMVTVTAVTTTTFTAVFLNGHNNTATVRAIVIYANEIANDLVAKVNALNPSHLRNSTALIQSTALDLTDELYEDEWPQDILVYLAARGGANGNQFEAGVWENRLLHLRPRYSASRTWLVDARNLTISRSMDNFRNQTYAVYRDANNRLKRTAVQTNTVPFGTLDLSDARGTPPFNRRDFINANTTSQRQAETERDIHITETAVPTPRAQFAVGGLYDEAGGGPYPLWMARAGDLVIIRNLSPGLGTAVDRLRNFRIKRKRYDVIADVLELTPELELPDLAVMAANSLTTSDRQRPYTRIEA
ncbi:MAG: hypothetical protein KF770_17515 [Anaerolineae bacterium]|nr:hypothetical protein [Anaerolineae bacterium]